VNVWNRFANISGDTDYSDLLAHIRKLEPDLMIACTNGGFYL
jgi:hypothetical protein